MQEYPDILDIATVDNCMLFTLVEGDNNKTS